MTRKTNNPNGNEIVVSSKHEKITDSRQVRVNNAQAVTQAKYTCPKKDLHSINQRQENKQSRTTTQQDSLRKNKIKLQLMLIKEKASLTKY